MKNPNKNSKMPPVFSNFNSMVYGQDTSSDDDAGGERAQDIELALIDSFPNHPYSEPDDGTLSAMVESIKTFGSIHTPVHVRKLDGGRYQLISGHRRKMATEMAGIPIIPCIVKDVDLDVATILMADSNVQRERIKPSEKARAYHMAYEAIKRKIGRPRKDDAAADAPALSQSGEHRRLDEGLASLLNESRSQFHRFLRLNNLAKGILDMVDKGDIGITEADELIGIPSDQQEIIRKVLTSLRCTLDMKKATELNRTAKKKPIDRETVTGILTGAKAATAKTRGRPKTPVLVAYVKKHETLSKYFKTVRKDEEIEARIIRALALLDEHEASKA